MNALTKATLNALMIVVVVSPLAIAPFSSAADAACQRVSGKPGRLEPGGPRAMPQNWLQEFKG